MHAAILYFIGHKGLLEDKRVIGAGPPPKAGATELRVRALSREYIASHANILFIGHELLSFFSMPFILAPPAGFIDIAFYHGFRRVAVE